MAFGPATMMLPTHVLVGIALALPVAVAFPEFTGIALCSGVLGGVLPDLDLYAGHRKTLHFPVYYSVFGLLAILIALFVQTPLPIAAAIGLSAAAAHSLMDIFGGGLELRPWEATSDRAVYDHHHGYWIVPRRWVRYDGAPEDLLLTLSIAGPLLFVLDDIFRGIVVTAVVIAVVYAAFRRQLPAIAERLIEDGIIKTLPHRVVRYIPARYTG